MIKSIVMKDCATYTDCGVIVDNCTKINFVYGPNGSGKSTISNYLSKQNDPQFNSCEVKWEGSPVDIIVYNRDFRDRHFKESEEFAGVFTLGEATIDQINLLNSLKKARSEAAENLENRMKTLAKMELVQEKHTGDFRKTAWETIYKQNVTDFPEVFSGLKASKEKFCKRVIYQYKKSNKSEYTREDLLKRYTKLFSQKIENYEQIDFSINSLIESINEIKNDSIWERVIVGNNDLPIAKLIKFLGNTDWVKDGRTYISGDLCPFCQQKTITENFQKQLSDFFGEEYEAEVSYVNELTGRFQSMTDQIFSMIDLIPVQKLAEEFDLIDISLFNTQKEALKAKVISTLSEMRSKGREPSKKIIIPDVSKNIQNLSSFVNLVNIEINKHNKIVDNFVQEREQLIEDVWTFLVDDNEHLIFGYLKDIADIEKGKQGVQNQIEFYAREKKELECRISEQGKNITSVQPTVDEINRLLKAYGFTSFEISPSNDHNNYYQIKRMDGSLATNTLSEGEETFISFLYFMQLAKGSVDANKVASKKIIVLDDPICSLDSTILYIVSSIVRTLIKDVREDKSDVSQIFILTHNVFFHKEASFVDGRAEEINDINYWIINKDNNVSTIRAFGKHNPIKTSYELLWQELKANTSPSNITIQNTMRRILENYFSILGRKIDETIVDSFSTIEDQTICRSLISWINDGSHTIPDDLYVDSYTDSVGRYKHIFREIFVKMGHQAHYDMMMH